MRTIVSPSRIAFASSSRLASVDGDGVPSVAGRITALLDALPFVSSENSVTGYHAVDTIVMSGNPLLAALALRGCARSGVRAAIGIVSGDDPWPYDLASTDEMAHILASSLRMDLPHGPPGGAMCLLMERVLADLPRDYPVVTRSISPGNRHADEEGVFFLGEDAPQEVWRPVDPHHLRMWSVFARFMKGRNEMAASSRGKTVIFARDLVLTSRPRSFGTSRISAGLISWDGPITAHGSARWDLPTYPDAAKAMLEDIIGLARGMPVPSSHLHPAV